MANKSVKKPQSLNDSHYRFLQDLSAPPKTSSKPLADENDTPIQPRNLIYQDVDDDTIPQFSAITDFDSPIGQNSPENIEPVRVEEAPIRNEVPRFSDNCSLSQKYRESRQPSAVEEAPLSEFPQFFYDYSYSQNSRENRKPVKAVEPLSQNYAENHQPVKPVAPLSQNYAENRQPVKVKEALLPKEVVPQRVDNNSLKEEKNTKVKVQGRRRLCKAADKEAAKKVAVDEPKLDDLADFDSPIPVRKNVIEIEESKGKSQIRDILNDLTSRFDALSVEKKPQPKPVPKPVERFEGGKEIFEDEGLEFGSAGSSFSPKQDPHDTLSKDTKNDSGDIEYESDDESDDSVQVLDHFEPENDGSITLSDPRSTYKLQPKIAKMLYPHQREGLKWLWSLHVRGKGGILGDDMGLGKTMQICGFLAGLFYSRLIRRVLVVAPKTLLPHWIKELSAVGLSEKTREYFGSCAKLREYELQYILQDKGVLLTTYDIVRNNTRSLTGHRYIDEDDDDGPTWDYMILDEGHLIKNPSTQRAKSLLEIPSAHRIIISGTPLQNNLKLLGDKKWFKDKYETPILRGNDKNASDRDKRVGSAIAKELRDHIQPYFLRQTRNHCVASVDQYSATSYEAFLKSEIVLSAFDGSPLAALTILKKICDHPLLLTKRAAEDVLEGMDSMLKPDEVNVAEKLAMHIADVAETDKFKDEHDVSCKITFIMSLLDNLIPEGHRVLIFSQTRKMLNLIQECITSKGYDFLRIDGTTKSSDRIKVVDDFQDGVGAPIFLLTSQVGGLGLTLTRADRVIVVDPAWNPSTDNQSVDRAYRIGQKKDVIVYRLMTCGTVEEKIYRKQVYKGGLFKTVSEKKEQTRYFCQQDLKELFSLPKEGFDVSVTQRQLAEKHDSQHIVDDSFHAHIELLKSQGIAGISHHSLLFSKTEPVQEAPEHEVTRIHNTQYIGTSSSSSYSHERIVDGAAFAFNPKDVNLHKKDSSPSSVGKLTELEIKDRLDRLSQMLSNTVMISKLPDKGEKLKNRIVELNRELTKLKMEQTNVVDLDDITDEFERVVNV
ncbi:Protein CHROMATIN REMODELING 24 [Trifolium repens]|nr:Protein CHROMATIN REMODELING 24 [Trifolium repens]